ncbi:MAG: PQQ-binding-like beta-propeller repeat protein, partial [Acidobacteriia bacterium]|nr:PQQ-binding-like beta-propeller repeat protein [Terriglobia bacterium]
MRHFRIAVSALFVLPALAAGAADQWPMYLGSLGHASYNAGQTQLNPQNAAQLKQLWKINVGSVISTGVTVAGGRLYFGDWNGYFYSVDASTGAIAWKTFVGKSPDPPDPTCQPGTGVTGQGVVSGASVYVPGGDSAVYALDLASGAVQWKTPLADPQGGSQLWSSLMLSGNALYVGIASLGDCPVVRGGVARIDLANPTQPLIQYLVPDGGDGGAGVWSTPAVDEQANLLYATTGNADSQDATQGSYGSAMVAMDATTLAIKAYFFMPLRPTDADMDFGSSPSLFQTPDGRQYVAANGKDGVMYVLNRPDLSPAWVYKLATGCVSPEQGCGSISTPAFDGRNVFVGAGQTDAAYDAPGSVYALDPVTHSPLWVYNAPAMVLAPVTLTPGLVFVPTSQGPVVLDAAGGSELWKESQAEGQYAQVAVTNGAAYATYVNGDVIAWGIPASGASEPFTGPVLFATPSALTYRYTAGGPKPAAQDLAVYPSSGSPALTITSDSAWLTAGATSGT